jgi:hypothetical protein
MRINEGWIIQEFWSLKYQIQSQNPHKRLARFDLHRRDSDLLLQPLTSPFLFYTQSVPSRSLPIWNVFRLHHFFSEDGINRFPRNLLGSFHYSMASESRGKYNSSIRLLEGFLFQVKSSVRFGQVEMHIQVLSTQEWYVKIKICIQIRSKMELCFQVSEDDTCRRLKFNVEFIYLIPIRLRKRNKIRELICI